MTLGPSDVRAHEETPLTDLFALVRARKAAHFVDEEVAGAVARAREAGISWGAIAAVLHGAQ